MRIAGELFSLNIFNHILSTTALIETIEHLEPPILQEAAEAQQQGHGRAIRYMWELAYNNADPRHWNNYAEFYEDMRR